jgi:hypothetical protein
MSIQDWQIFKGAIPEDDAKMVEIASKRPQECKDLIRKYGLRELGLKSGFYEVRRYSSRIRRGLLTVEEIRPYPNTHEGTAGHANL